MNAPTSALPTGRLLLVPTPLDFACATPAPITDVLPIATLRAAANTTHWITENAKSTRAFLKRVDEHCPLALPLQAQTIMPLPRAVHKKGDHLPTPDQGWDARVMLQAALEGQDIALVSEAGMPAVADPGSSVVRAAHDLGIEVVPLVGPVSLLLALAASGLNGQSFAFVGYLPQEAAERGARLKQLEALTHKTGQTQIWIETPYRNPAMLASALQTLQDYTRLAVASGLTMREAKVQSRSVAAWKNTAGTLAHPTGADAHTPAVYAMGV